MHNRCLLVFTILVIYRVDFMLTKNFINKCCSENEVFTYEEMSLKCVTIDSVKDSNINKTDELWWLPPNNLKDRKVFLNNNEISFKTLPDCLANSQDMLWSTDFNLIYSDTQLNMQILKDSSLHDPDVNHTEYFPSSAFCVEYMASNNEHISIVCPCTTMKCVRKCCMDTYAFDVASQQCKYVTEEESIKDWVPFLREEMAYELEYYRLTNKKPRCTKYLSHLIQNASAAERLNLLVNADIQNNKTGETFIKDLYCGDYTTNNEEMLLYCPRPPPKEASSKSSLFNHIKYTIYGILFIIGAIALFLAVVVAIFIPELRRNIHGKMSLAHNAMLLIGYVTFGVVLMTSRNNMKELNKGECQIISFVIQFSILSAFFWLNVMCIDIAWTFSGLQQIKTKRDRKKFAFYSLYAWGSTGVICVATAIVEFSSSVTSFKPDFGHSNCFFSNRGAMLMFFYGPMAILLLVNIALFVYTAARIISIKKQTDILNSTESSTNKRNKQRLNLYLKLFSIMGLTMVFEVISWAVGGESYFWIITDVINLLRGVFIFIIFCCKRSVYNLVLNRGLRMCGKEGLRLDSSFMAHRSMVTSSSSCTEMYTPEKNRKSILKKQNSKLPLMSFTG